MATVFYGTYEDAKKTETFARKHGWVEGESFFDSIRPEDCVTVAKRFSNRAAATAWVIKKIEAGVTVFGCGDVLEIKEVPSSEQCRYCTCNGMKRLRRWIIDGDADELDGDYPDECLN